jgi:hypothetical protein
MHLQIRSVAKASPPDLARFLGVLAKADVNLLAAGGGSLELGGEFAFAPEHDHAGRAVDALTAAGYEVRLLDVGRGDFQLCWLTNEPGQLHACIAKVSEENLAAGRVIADVLVGVERDAEGRIPVQVYSVEVRSAANS